MPEAVVLLQMGGPETLDDLEPFLANLFADREIIRLPRWMTPFQPRLARFVARRRAPKMRPKYAHIGGGSPLRRETEAQAAALEAELARRGRNARVVVAMRYTAPRAETAVAALRGFDRVTLLPLYPHYSGTTTGTSVSDFARAAPASMRLSLVRGYGTFAPYVSLLAEQIEEAWKRIVSEGHGEEAHLVLSAHGIPESYAKRGDPYPAEVEATAERLVETAREIGFADARLGYQSKIGPVEWVKPYTDDVIRDAKAAGARTIVALPLGFVSDHIETLWDLDVTYKEHSEALGLHYRRVPAFNDDPRFIRVLAEALERLPPVEVAR